MEAAHRTGNKRSLMAKRLRRMPASSKIAVCSLLFLSVPFQALAQPRELAEHTSGLGPICRMIESAAQANALPIDFFARVIWQESRFRSDVVGPMTHTGARALGIAQFMPETAAERHLLKPFDPVEALPKSGRFLAELRDEFGNLGLAAAAYNAGPQRVRDYITGARGLPTETRNYVLGITGRSVESWAKEPKSEANAHGEEPTDKTDSRCLDLETILKQESNSSSVFLRPQVVPSWCEHLHHPNTSVCGAVHQVALYARTDRPRKMRSRMGVFRASTR
jgi:hypothetical protein